jgi:hypothetical protein
MLMRSSNAPSVSPNLAHEDIPVENKNSSSSRSISEEGDDSSGSNTSSSHTSDIEEDQGGDDKDEQPAVPQQPASGKQLALSSPAPQDTRSAPHHTPPSPTSFAASKSATVTQKSAQTSQDSVRTRQQSAASPGQTLQSHKHKDQPMSDVPPKTPAANVRKSQGKTPKSHADDAPAKNVAKYTGVVSAAANAALDEGDPDGIVSAMFNLNVKCFDCYHTAHTRCG